MTEPVARDFAHAIELASGGEPCKLLVVGEAASREASGKLRVRLGPARGLVEVLDVEPRPGTCRSCGAAILWATTPRGKAMPLDAEPGKRVVLGARTSLAHVLDCYTPHWATCPSADEHRK